MINRIKGVYFYNNWHNGDLHVSRNMVKVIINELKEKRKDLKFYYAHYRDGSILSDIPAKFENKHNQFLKSKVHTPYFEKNGLFFINTWYGINGYHFWKKYGPSIDCLYEVMKTPAKMLGVDFDKIENKSILFPEIDYRFYDVDKINTNFMNDKVNVLLSNGTVHSNQSSNESMNGIIQKMAKGNPNVNFLVTNVIQKKIALPNVYYTQDVIGKRGCDLNENGYLTEKCDIVVGRASGVHTFALNINNLFQRDCDILSFSNFKDNDQFFISSKFCNDIKYKANCPNYKNNSMNFIHSKTQEAIEKWHSIKK